MRTATETVENAIEKGIEYIHDEENDVTQARRDYTYPLCPSDDAQSYWEIADDKKTRQGNHATRLASGGFELETFVYAHGVFEGLRGRTLRLVIDVTRGGDKKIINADFFWKDITD